MPAWQPLCSVRIRSVTLTRSAGKSGLVPERVNEWGTTRTRRADARGGKEETVSTRWRREEAERTGEDGKESEGIGKVNRKTRERSRIHTAQRKTITHSPLSELELPWLPLWYSPERQRHSAASLVPPGHSDKSPERTIARTFSGERERRFRAGSGGVVESAIPPIIERNGSPNAGQQRRVASLGWFVTAGRKSGKKAASVADSFVLQRSRAATRWKRSSVNVSRDRGPGLGVANAKTNDGYWDAASLCSLSYLHALDFFFFSSSPSLPVSFGFFVVVCSRQASTAFGYVFVHTTAKHSAPLSLSGWKESVYAGVFNSILVLDYSPRVEKTSSSFRPVATWFSRNETILGIVGEIYHEMATLKWFSLMSF